MVRGIDFSVSIIKISKLEFQRNFRISTRRTWSIIYTLFIQISFVLIIVSSLRLSNFLSKEEHLRLLTSIFLTFQIYSLPGFVIMMTYDNFIQDPVLDIFAVASTKRSKFLLGKFLATFAYIYFIFIWNNALGLLILFIIFPQRVILSYFVSSLLAFIIVVLFFTASTIFLLLLVRRRVTDRVSTIFLPLTFYYIIPFLLVNSLSYQVFNPIITNFVPTVWVLNFIELTVFNNKIVLEIIYLPLSIVFLLIYSIRVFTKFEFN